MSVVVPSGLGATIGFAEEETIGTFTDEDMRWVPFTSDKVIGKKLTKQSEALSGYPAELASRRVITGWDAGGAVVLDVTDQQMGLFFKHGLGSTPEVIEVSTGVYDQFHTWGNDLGLSLSQQSGRPTTAGSIQPFSYNGGKVTDAELSIDNMGLAQWTMTLDYWAESTSPDYAAPSYLSPPDNVLHFAEAQLLIGGTVTASATVAGCSTTGSSTTITSSSNFATAGVVVGMQIESLSVYVTAVSGTSITVSTAVTVASDTSLAFSGLATVTGDAAPGATVKSFSLKIERGLDVSRRTLGSLYKREQLLNAFPKVTGELAVEWDGTSDFYEAFEADTAVALVLDLTGPEIASSGLDSGLNILVPSLRWEAGPPETDGPAILNLSLPFTAAYDDATGAPLVQFIYQSADEQY